jgi:beta-glucosidase/6-phospho-beta-glucosidase/beta-galactosidase
MKTLAPWTLAALLALGCSGSGETSPAAPPPENLAFPKDFLFGAATAGFQVDMGCPTLPASECDDPNSDWYEYVTSPAMKADSSTHLTGEPLSVSPGHWELYEDDLDLLEKQLHAGAFRFSFEWSRIFPKATDGVDGYDALKAIANAPAIAHYHAVLASLKKRGVVPLVTLNHYTLPNWIHDGVGCHIDLDKCTKRGWLDASRTIQEIAKYAGFVAREFGAEVDLWATENEPFAVVLPGYILPTPDRTNPPAVSLKFAEAKAVIDALVHAHARMYDAVKANDTEDADGNGKPSEVGLVYAMAPMAPMDPDRALDVAGAKNLFYLYNMVFLNAVAKGDFDADLSGKAVHQADLENRMDYLGVNYYTRGRITGTNAAFLPELSPLSTFNPITLKQETYPQGLYDMVTFVHHEFGRPIIVTENGVNDPTGELGPNFVRAHLTWLGRAIRDGADVRGYFYWSLMDNYEWNHGTGMRFGLYAVDPADPQKKRVPRDTVEAYSAIVQARAIDPSVAAMFPAR